MIPKFTPRGEGRIELCWSNGEVPPADHDSLIKLQRLLLPSALPAIGCTEAAAAYRSANDRLHVGGDWFDLIDRPDNNTVIGVVGDVVGHGLAQVGVMGQLRAASAALAQVADEPDAVLHGLDRFAGTVAGAEHATVAVVVLDGTNQARTASAGHPPPIRVTPEGRTQVIETGRRAPLTVASGNGPTTFELCLGDLLVMYTDGVVERSGENIDRGIEALGKFVASRRKLDCLQIAVAIVDEFGVDASDDQAVLVLRPVHRRADGHRPAVSQVSLGLDEIQCAA